MTIKLSVALCTYNPRPDVIARAVRAVVDQLEDFSGSSEFLVVDNNSDPPLANAGYLRGLPIDVVREPRQGLTAAREAAIRRARGDIVLFVDDDNIVAPGYLRGVVSAFADTGLGVLGGRVMPEYESPPQAWLSSFETQLAIRRHAPDRVVETTGLPWTAYFPVGAGCAVRREMALAYLDDAERYGRIEGRKGHELSAGEDLDMDFFALSAGYSLRMDGALSLIHVIPASRCTEEYISRLVVSGLRSASELDQKWTPRFGAEVFPFLHTGAAHAQLRVLAFRLLSPFSVASRIKRRTWEAILRLQRDQRRNASDV